MDIATVRTAVFYAQDVQVFAVACRQRDLIGCFELVFRINGEDHILELNRGVTRYFGSLGSISKVVREMDLRGYEVILTNGTDDIDLEPGCHKAPPTTMI
jgi:hypothetical protein